MNDFPRMLYRQPATSSDALALQLRAALEKIVDIGAILPDKAEEVCIAIAALKASREEGK